MRPFHWLAGLFVGRRDGGRLPGSGRLSRFLCLARGVVQPDPSEPLLVRSPFIAALLSLVPGLGHLYLKRWRGAAILVPLGALCFVVAARYYGTAPAVWAMSLYAGLAVASIFLVGSVRVEGPTWLRFIVLTVLIMLVWPFLDMAAMRAGRLWPTFYVTVDMDHGPFEAGTRLEFRRHAFDTRRPGLGEMVLTRTRTLDVVLGLPGDLVEWRNEGLYRNGERQDDALRPLAYRGNPPPFEVEVPGGHFLLLPAARGYDARDPIQFRNVILPAALVPERDIWYAFVGPYPLGPSGAAHAGR